MKLIERNGKYIAESSYEERAIPKMAKFRWDPVGKQWWTDDLKKAAELAAYADDELRARFQDILDAKAKVIADSRATDSDVEIPRPDGLEFLPYQRAGIAYALKRNNVLIGDDMGLGKTVQAIGISNADPSVKKVLVICPSSLRLNWKREWEKWDVKNLSVGVAYPNEYPATDVVVINYDILHKHDLRKSEWDLLIVDEAHYLKNPKAKRTAQVFGLWHRDPAKRIAPIGARRKVFLTGTPILNRPAELWTLAHNLAPEVFKNWRAFVIRYAAAVQTRYGWDVKGASNLDELQEKLRESVMVRRLKKDVLAELPSKRRQVIELPTNGASALVEREKSAWEKNKEHLDSLRVAVELAKVSDDEAEYQQAVLALREGISAAFTEMAKLRHEVALAKVPYVVSHVEDALESGKVILFAHHKDVIEKILEAFPDAVSITGDTSLENRQKAVDAFQNNDKVRLFVGNIKAAGVGLTLTASSHVIFTEGSWVPGEITQAEDRAHRIGQQNSVLVQHLVLEGSLDAVMAQTVVNKQAVIDKALDAPGEVDFIIPDKIEHVEVTKEEVAKVEIPDSVVAAIHEGLKIVSAYCDGAQQLDGMGFSKIDTGIGHSLANAHRLTVKQAALGRKLVLKYKRQVPAELLEIIK